MSRGSIATVHPDSFFREDGPIPATVTLTFVRPPEYAGIPADGFAGILRARVEAVAADAEAKWTTRCRTTIPLGSISRVHGSAAPIPRRCSTGHDLGKPRS
jgi:hypothetical protein